MPSAGSHPEPAVSGRSFVLENGGGERSWIFEISPARFGKSQPGKSRRTAPRTAFACVAGCEARVKVSPAQHGLSPKPPALTETRSREALNPEP